MQMTRNKKVVKAEVDMTPMIDIIFQLIIFFMLVAQFQEMESENLALPDSEEGKPREEEKVKQVVINVRKDGTIVIGGSIYSQNAVTGLIAGELQKRSSDTLKVIIRADQQVEFGHVQDVMGACAKGGAFKVAFAVVTPGGEAGGG